MKPKCQFHVHVKPEQETELILGVPKQAKGYLGSMLSTKTTSSLSVSQAGISCVLIRSINWLLDQQPNYLPISKDIVNPVTFATYPALSLSRLKECVLIGRKYVKKLYLLSYNYVPIQRKIWLESPFMTTNRPYFYIATEAASNQNNGQNFQVWNKDNTIKSLY